MNINNEGKMYSVLCEHDRKDENSDEEFLSKPLLLERYSNGLEFNEALDIAEALKNTGNYGRVWIVEIVIDMEIN